MMKIRRETDKTRDECEASEEMKSKKTRGGKKFVKSFLRVMQLSVRFCISHEAASRQTIRAASGLDYFAVRRGDCNFSRAQQWQSRSDVI